MRLRFVLFLTLIFLSAACHRPSQDRDDKNTCTIATLYGPSSMGMIRFIDSISGANNTDIKIEILNEPVQVRKMMIEGSADFAILPTTMAAILYNKGVDYRLIAIPVWGTLYLFGSDSTITGWNDLRNKTVNVMDKGMTPDVLFRCLLEKNGIDPEKDLTLDYRFPTHVDLANAVAAGQAKLGVITEPLVSLVMQKNKNVHPIFDLNREWISQLGIPVAQTAFIGKESFIREHPQLVEQITSACERSSEWVNQNPDSAASLIVKYHILPDYEVALNAIPRSNLHFVRANTVETQIREYLSVFYSMNPDIIGGKIPDEAFFY